MLISIKYNLDIQLLKGAGYTVNGKFFAAVLSAAMLTACSGNSAEIETTSAASVTTTEISSASSVIEEHTETEGEAAETEYTPHETEAKDTSSANFDFYVQPLISQYELVDDFWTEIKNPPFGVPDLTKKEWDSNSAADYPDDVWSCIDEPIFVFTNYSETAVTAESIQIIETAGNTPVTFADGGDTLEINLDIPAESMETFLLEKNIFDCSGYRSGVYKAVVSFDEDSMERLFFIDNESTDFLTDEQKDILSETAARQTEEISYGRGVDITVYHCCFLPVFSDGNEVRFENIVTHVHKDDPCRVWFETLDYRMIKTEDGWEFDSFQLWY